MREALLGLFANILFIKFIIAFIGIIALNFIFKLVKKSVSRHISDSELRYRIRKLITFVSYIVILIFILVVFYERLRTFTIAFGVIGAGIALASQEVIVSIAGWIAISIGNFYKIGDRVELGGIQGDVIDVSILRTTVMELGEWVGSDLYTGRIVRIANSFVFKQPVFNYTGDFPFLWDNIKIPVRYGSDYHLARKVLLDVTNEIGKDYIKSANFAWKRMTRKYVVEPAETKPMISLVANDNWIEFTVRYITNYKTRVLTKDKLFTRILEEFDKTDGKIKIASQTFDLVHAPSIKVDLEHPNQKT